MIAVIDYGAGNLFSVRNALNFLGIESEVTRDEKEIRKADGLILPGVGAFPDAMEMLSKSGLTDTIREEAVKKPFLGICLGMQMLFEESTEFRRTEGLGLLRGTVDWIRSPYKIPHMGWNSLQFAKKSPLLEDVDEGAYVYFVHSFQAYPAEEDLSAFCDYRTKIPALVERGTVFGAQFHPEKSGDIGLTILRNFGRLTR